MTTAGASAAVVELEDGGHRDPHRPRPPRPGARRRALRCGASRLGDDGAGVRRRARPARRRGALRDARARRSATRRWCPSAAAWSACSRTPTCSPPSRGPGSAPGARSTGRATSTRSPRWPARLPALMLELHHSSVPALELARVLSALADALTRRALELVVRRRRRPRRVRSGSSIGSQARRELTPASTRRGALVHGAGSPPTGRVDGRASPPPWRAAGCTGRWSAHDAAAWTARRPAAMTWRCRCSPTAGSCGARRPSRCRSPTDRSRAALLRGARRPGVHPTACRPALTPMPC